MKPKKIRSLFKQESEGKFKDFNLNLLSKDARKFVKNINKDERVNLRVVEMPQLLLEDDWTGYLVSDVLYGGLWNTTKNIKSVNALLFLKRINSKKQHLLSFWHEVGHLLFKININKKLKKEIIKEVKNHISTKKKNELKELCKGKYSMKKIGEELICELFAESVPNKSVNTKNVSKEIFIIINACNILLKQFSLLLNDKKSL